MLQSDVTFKPVADGRAGQQQATLQPFPVRIQCIGGFKVFHRQGNVLRFAEQFTTPKLAHDGPWVQPNGMLVVHQRFAIPL